MDSFPAFIPLKGARVVVVGDGEAAEAKARLFVGSPADLVRLSVSQALAPEALAEARLVFIAAAGRDDLDRLLDAAYAAGALTNVVDQPTLSDFYTPAIVDRGPIVAGIGTTGTAPVLATLLRAELETRWPTGLSELGSLSTRLQARVRAAVPGLAERRRVWRSLMLGPAGQAALQGDPDGAEALAVKALATEGHADGRVLRFVVPPLADDLTLGLLRALGDADRLVIGHGLAAAALDYARRDAVRVDAATEAEISAWVEAGLVVVILSPAL